MKLSLKINMDVVNCVLLVIILILVIVCCFKREKFSAPSGNDAGITNKTIASGNFNGGNEIQNQKAGNQSYVSKTNYNGPQGGTNVPHPP